MSFVFASGLLHSILPSHWLLVGLLASLYKISFFRSIALFFFTSFFHAIVTFFGMLVFDWMMLHYLSHMKLFSFLVFIYMEALGFYYFFSFYKRRKKPFSLEGHHHVHALVLEKNLDGRFPKSFFFPYFSAVFPMTLIPNWSWIIFPMGLGHSVFYDSYFLGMMASYFFCMIFLMSVLMFLAYQGLSHVKQAWIDRNSRFILGFLFVTMGFLNDVSHSVLSRLKF